MELFLSISGSLHFLLLAPQGFPKPSLAAEGICSKGHLGFVKNKPGTVWRDLWVGIWRIKDEPTETEGKRAMRKQELQEMQFKKKNPPVWLLKSPPFAAGLCPGEVLLTGKDPPVPGLHLKKKKNKKQANKTVF